MKIGICGLGYVGLTSAACLLKQGHTVHGVDVSESKVRDLKAGKCPIHEPGLLELLRGGLDSGKFTVDSAIHDGDFDDFDVVLVCVGTPSAPNGSHNLGYIAEVSRQIAASFGGSEPLTVAFRSTVHPGTIEKLVLPIVNGNLRDGAKIDIVYNPEFLRESTAIKDYFDPPRIVVGTEDGQPNAAMDEMYEAIEAPRFVTHWKESEITKLVDNTFHAVKITFANEIGRVCRQLGVDAKTVHKIFVSDTKLNISPYYLRPGSAFGGSCLPKDVRALTYLSTKSDAHTFLVDSLIRSNEQHKQFILGLATAGLEPGAKVLLNGLAFKKDSDDLRESPYVDLAMGLLDEGYDLRILDDDVKIEALVGNNLGFAFSHLPGLDQLIVKSGDLAGQSFDRIVDARGNGSELGIDGASIVDVTTL